MLTASVVTNVPSEVDAVLDEQAVRTLTETVKEVSSSAGMIEPVEDRLTDDVDQRRQLPSDLVESSGTSCHDRKVTTRLSVGPWEAKRVSWDVVGPMCEIVFQPVKMITIDEAQRSMNSPPIHGVQASPLRTLRLTDEVGTQSVDGPSDYYYVHNSRTIQDLPFWDVAKLVGNTRYYYENPYAWWEDDTIGDNGWARASAHDNDANWEATEVDMDYTDSDTFCNSEGDCDYTVSVMSGSWDWSFAVCTDKTTTMIVRSKGWYHGGGSGQSWTFGDWCPGLHHATSVWTSGSPGG